MQGIQSDSLKWKYAANTVVQVPVADDAGKVYYLDVTDKTKLEIKSIFGDVYRFYLRSTTIDGANEGMFGSNARWSGFDLREHATRYVVSSEISSVTVLAEAPALHPISHGR